MTKGKKIMILRGKGLFLQEVAKAHKLHPNTVRKWCKRLKTPIQIVLMRSPESRYFRQALRTADVRRFVEFYREMGGRI